ATFAAISAGAAWFNANLSWRAQRRELRARRGYLVVRGPKTAEVGDQPDKKLAFAIANVGGRPVYSVGGYVVLIGEALSVGPEQLAPFSLANEIPAGSDLTAQLDKLVLGVVDQPLYVGITLSYTDAVLDEGYTSLFSYRIRRAPEQAVKMTAAG